MTQDIPVDTIVKYRLGRLVKVVRNRAIRNLNKSIADSSTEVMDKWRRLLTEGYSSAENQQQPTASLRLPVEKDAPTTVTGPKTAGNKTAFELSNAPSFFSRTTSQQHQQQQQQTDMTTFLQQSNTAHIKNSISKCLSAKSSKSRTTQRVRFKPDHQFVTVQKRHVDTCREKVSVVLVGFLTLVHEFFEFGFCELTTTCHFCHFVYFLFFILGPEQTTTRPI
ncbi:unnamed protein product [Absidia cylindrospora]